MSQNAAEFMESSDPANTSFFKKSAERKFGFVSTRFHGTDGVTLEAKKWAHVLEQDGHKSFWMAGMLDTPEESSYLVPLAYFRHERINALHDKLFGCTVRTRTLTNEILRIKETLKDEIYFFIQKFNIEVLVPQNVLAIPMHIPLGLAVTEVIAETGMPTLAHHHDFSWERERFTLNSVGDYLQAAFPPLLHGIQHFVINSMGQKELSRRFGLSSEVIPNVLDFETPPPAIDDFNADFRNEIGLSDEDYMILQPTRVVARKGIEHAVDLVRRLKDKRAKLVISHPAGDEGDTYMRLIQERIEDSGIEVLFIADRIGLHRGEDENGRKTYTLFDVYPHADLITYPSLYEGFGNAFLEAIYFRKPIVVNTYTVYARDIAPLGFKTIAMDQLISNEVVSQVREILKNSRLREEWAETNYNLATKYFSYSVVRRHLAGSLARIFGEGG